MLWIMEQRLAFEVDKYIFMDLSFVLFKFCNRIIVGEKQAAPQGKPTIICRCMEDIFEDVTNINISNHC